MEINFCLTQSNFIKYKKIGILFRENSVKVENMR